MFCKYCGNEIDLSKSVCPACGKPYSLEGGNGFWDMAGGQRLQPDPEPQPDRGGVVNGVKIFHRVPWAVCAVLCLLCLVLFVSGKVSKAGAVRETEAEYKAKLSQQEEMYENRIKELENSIARLQRNDGTDIPVRQPIRVLASPTDESLASGFESREGFYLFRFEIEGSAVSFQWEKQRDNGEWEPLEFDGEGINGRYGLMLEEDCEEGVSKLIAVGLTEESAGTYKCTVLTEDNSESATVRLSIQEDEMQGAAPLLPEKGGMKDGNGLETDEPLLSDENGGEEDEVLTGGRNNG